jgi:hypothetical protein
VNARSDLEAAFAAAAERDPRAVREHRLCFAGRPVRLRAVGAALAEQARRPFVHLAGGEDEPVLSLDLWDGRATGVGCPVAPAEESRAHVLDGDGRWVRHLDLRSVTDYDRATGRVVGWRADEHSNPSEGRAKPLPVILPLWYLDQAVYFGHAALVARDSAGVLLAGRGGSGKSTASLACAAAGLEFLGDDQAGLEQTGPESFVGHSLWSVAGTHTEHLRRNPELTCDAERTLQDGDKTLLFLAEGSRARLAASVPIKAIVLPRPSGGESSRLVPATAPEALLAIAPTSVMGLGVLGGRWGFDLLDRLVRSVPAFRLEAGSHLPDLVRGVERALDLAGA